jgi:uncharacterized cupredoxin-like copper-binding protein
VPGRAAALLWTLVVLVPACGDEAAPPPPPQRPGTVVVGGEPANDHGTEQVSEDADLEIEAGDLFFAPTVLLGAPELALPARVRAAGQERHTITAPELGIDEEIEPGESVEIELTFPESGTTVFFCRYHRAQGMLGVLVAT